MTSLKLQRHNAGWLPKEVVAALREVPASDTTSRMDKRLYSKIELGLADLTVAQAEALAERWDVPIEYIRRPNPAESTESPKIAVATRPKAQAGPGTQVYRMTADLPRELADAEAPLAEKLKVCGYNTLVEWQVHNLKLLNSRYRKKKAATDGANIEGSKTKKDSVSGTILTHRSEKVNV